MIRFFFLWTGLTTLFALWFFVLTAKEKTDIKRATTKTAIASVVAGVTISVLYLINNVSGV